ncbi:MAG: DUF2868 domain-containing protein [Planctomycetales bacterium]|nr:DUF2868 domain-containing protein [Planctomycetales bacterium]
MKRSKPWEIADLIDFEYLLAGEAGITNETTSRPADQRFQTEKLPALQAAGNMSRPAVFRSWLGVQRDIDGLQLPGEHWKTASHWLVVLSIIAGAGLGGSLTATLLLYHGDVPVNVPWFLACTLGVQMLLLLVAAVLWVLRITTNLLDDFRPLLDGFVWVTSAGLRKLSGEQRQRLQAIFARIARRREIYGSLATWPFVVVTQVFGVWFNLGILVVLLAHISVKDIEFGWQSSFVQSDEVAYQMAAGMAVPWKWFAPSPHPTLLEVTDSHFRYKKEHSNKSWWPFLCYSVACYGLLLRGVLLVFALAKWRGAMRRLTFDHEGCPSLYRRLVGPTIRSHGGTPELEIPSAAVTENRRAACGEAFVMVATDTTISEDHLARYIRNNYGWTLAAMHKAQIDHPSGNAAVLSTFVEKAAALVAVVVVVPAERPPIKAIALFLGKIAKVKAKSELVLLMVGRKEETGFAAVDEENLKFWQNFVAINKLHVSLEKWSET